MPDRPEMLERARAMRREQTPAEHAMWRMLRSRGFEGLKFRRQLPLGPYIVDFACLDPRVVIECDGGQHADNPYDVRRDAWLREQGFRVLRIWNNDILDEPEGVDAALRQFLGR